VQRDTQRLRASRSSGGRRRGSRPSPPGPPDLERAQTFLERFLERAAIAIASPTDFICVVRRKSAVGNFSNAKRGTLTTT